MILHIIENPSLLFSIPNFENDVSSKIKNVNSIQFKIENYYKNHQDGKIPINKCLNDILGIRIVLKEDMPLENIITYIKEEFPNLKVINSSKNKLFMYTLEKEIIIYFNENYKYG